MNNLNFGYNSHFSIQNLSFKVEEESVYALLGNNGAGKTTLLRLLVGLLKPGSGEIKIFNEPLTRNKNQLWKIRQQLGFLFQSPDDQLFAPTIEEDIAFGARNVGLDEGEVKKHVEWALNAVDLIDNRYQSPFNLSWGQKKRASLAGLLVMKPKLLLLDEPFANLDFKSIYGYLEVLEKLRKEQHITILFTTHELFFVENWADFMLVIDNGKKIFEGDIKSGLNNLEVKKIIGSYDEIKKLVQKK